MKKWLLLLSVLATGCNTLSTTPDLYIDNSFTPEEMEHILHGPKEWESKIDTFNFRITMVSHLDAVQRAADMLDNSMVFVRLVNKDDPACPDVYNMRKHMHGNVLATTYKSDWNGATFTCFNASRIAEDMDGGSVHTWDSTVVHEIGHAYNLTHDDHEDGAMWPNADLVHQTPELQCSDLRQFASLYNWALPGYCR